MTYWFPWKHPMARLWGIECWSDVTKNGLVGSALRALPLSPKFGLGPLGRAIHLFRRISMKTQPKCRLGPAGLTFRALQMPQPPLFHSFNVRPTVSDVPRSTPTTLSVKYSVCGLDRKRCRLVDSNCTISLIYPTISYNRTSFCHLLQAEPHIEYLTCNTKMNT